LLRIGKRNSVSPLLSVEGEVEDWFLNHRRNIDAYSEQTPEEYLAAYYRGFSD
jgi:hypothetical protein